MGYRFLVVLCAAFFLAGCAAFDSDSTPYEGMQPGEAVPGTVAAGGIYTGYYLGDMTVDANSCASVSDEAGAKIPLNFEVIHRDTTLEAIFDDESRTAGVLSGEKVILMISAANVKHVYYLTFAEGKITGSVEVIEADADGQYGKPCATYTLELKKGEKPTGQPGVRQPGEQNPDALSPKPGATTIGTSHFQ